MLSFKEYLNESIKSEIFRIFDSGPGGMEKKVDWRDRRSGTFTTKSRNSATIIMRGPDNFVVYDNSKSPPNNKLIDSSKVPAPLEALWTTVWGVS